LLYEKGDGARKNGKLWVLKEVVVEKGKAKGSVGSFLTHSTSDVRRLCRNL